MIAFTHHDRRLADDALGSTAMLLRRWPAVLSDEGERWLRDVDRTERMRVSDEWLVGLLVQARSLLDDVLAAPVPDDLPTLRPVWLYPPGTDLPDQAQRAREWVAELQRVRRWITVLLPEEHP